jgi:hypothetical protein
VFINLDTQASPIAQQLITVRGLFDIARFALAEPDGITPSGRAAVADMLLAIDAWVEATVLPEEKLRSLRDGGSGQHEGHRF